MSVVVAERTRSGDRESATFASRWRLVADAIRQEMIDGEYAPGQRLVEGDLARRHASSRFLVRRALDELAAERLLDQLPHRGAQLRTVSVATALELYAVRGALDTLVATEAAARRSARPAQRLAVLRTELVGAAEDDDVPRFLRARAECAALLGAISGHAEAQQLAEQTTNRLWWHRRRLVLSSRPPHVAAVDAIRVVDAVRAGDAAAARDAVISHIAAVGTALRRHG